MVNELLFANHFEELINKYNYPKHINMLVGYSVLKFTKECCTSTILLTLNNEKYNEYVLAGITAIFESYAHWVQGGNKPKQGGPDISQHGVN